MGMDIGMPVSSERTEDVVQLLWRYGSYRSRVPPKEDSKFEVPS